MFTVFFFKGNSMANVQSTKSNKWREQVLNSFTTLIGLLL